MPFDGFVMAAVVSELKEKILLGRIIKIYQPENNLIIFRIKKGQDSFQLLLSAHPVTGRMHLTAASRENPAQPPLFCMVLRKHLEGGRIVNIRQYELDRITEIFVESNNDLGELTLKKVMVEIMGKHSNIILVDPGNGTVLDGIRRYSHAVSRHREVLPGRPYLLPPSQGKAETLNVSEEEFREILLSLPLTTPVAKGILKKFSGFSPLLALEVVSRAQLDHDSIIDNLGDYDLIRLWQSFTDFSGAVNKNCFHPTVVKGQGGLLDFSCVLLEQFAESDTREFASVSQALDFFFTEKEKEELISSRKRELLKIVNGEIDRIEKKLSIQYEQLAEIEDADKWRLFGELITANMYQLSRGKTLIVLENFYHPGERVEIPLNPLLSPGENAQFFFKKYNKAKSSRVLIQRQTKKGQEEKNYLESISSFIENSTDLKDLEEIRSELAESGYLKDKTFSKAKKAAPASSQPLSFSSKEGFIILVGKNNKQNDFLTLKLAKKDDLWLHTKNIPGSHVIIRKKPGEEIPFSTIKEAAKLAAFFSKAKYSSQVPVDYTFVSQVKKPNGAKPGMVIYFEQKTIYVTPDLNSLPKR